MSLYAVRYVFDSPENPQIPQALDGTSHKAKPVSTGRLQNFYKLKYPPPANWLTTATAFTFICAGPTALIAAQMALRSAQMVAP